MRDHVGSEEQGGERLSLGDGWKCRTADTTMDSTESSRDWKQSGQHWHWYLDAKRCKDGESAGEYGHK